MLKTQIKRLNKQGYKQSTIIKKTGASKSYVSETLSVKKCMKRPHRITYKEYQIILKLRNG